MTNAPSITFLNMSGDVTISWEKEDEAAILAMIEQKMKENYRFFVLKAPLFPFFPKHKVELTNIEQARKAGKIVVPDELVNNLAVKLGDTLIEATVSQGKARVISRSKVTKADTAHLASSAQEVLRSNSVAVRALSGG